jgi:hypothetical protein
MKKIVQTPKKRRIFKKLKILFFLLAFVFAFSSFYWLIFYSELFSIKQIEITNLNNQSAIISREEILNEIKRQNRKYLLPYLKDSLSFVLLSQQELIKNVLNSHPEIEKLDIKLNIQNGILNVSYQPRKEKFNLCFFEGDCFLIDINGVPFKKLTIKNPSLDTIYLKQKEDIILGKRILEKSNLEELEKIILSLKEHQDLFVLDSFVLDKKNSSDFQIVTSKKMKIFLNFKENFSEILLILEKLKNQQLKGNFDGVDYIDLRYLPKVYYKKFK